MMNRTPQETQMEAFFANLDDQAVHPTDIYREGYWAALQDFGIWRDGKQRIGCLETPIDEAFEKAFPGEGMLILIREAGRR